MPVTLSALYERIVITLFSGLLLMQGFLGVQSWTANTRLARIETEIVFLRTSFAGVVGIERRTDALEAHKATCVEYMRLHP